MIEKNFEDYFFILFLILPISIVAGDTISLVNVLILDIFFFLFFFKKKAKLINHYSINFFIILNLYLIFNSLIAIEKELALVRSVGFLRFIILFVCINYFYDYIFNKKKVLNFWSFLILLVVIDIYVEFFLGRNIFGWGPRFIDGIEQPNGRRVVSFFKDEPIAGAYVSGFIFLIFGYLTSKFPSKKFIPFCFLIFAFFAIFFTGERSNSIKVFLGILIFFTLTDFISLKKKVSLALLFFIVISFFYKYSDFLGNRYFVIANNFNSKDKILYQYENNLYIKLYKSGYNVFKNSPYFGVGNKNYRVVACSSEKEKFLPLDYLCLTHPHQIYFEFLSEHGLIGTLILLSLFFFIIFKMLFEIVKSKNQIQLCCFIYVLINFTPLLPSGSFFTDFNATMFWLNFSLMFACNEKTNIFRKNFR